jgi:hypothetical protein
VVLDEEHRDAKAVAMSRISATRAPTSSWLSPLAGSSRRRSFGSDASARASSTRFCVPERKRCDRRQRDLLQVEQANELGRALARLAFLAPNAGKPNRMREKAALRAAVAAERDVLENG